MHVWRTLVAAAAVTLLTTVTPAQAVEGKVWGRGKPKVTTPAPAPGVRAAMVEPLTAARSALQIEQYSLALEWIADAEALAESPAHLSNYERYVIARMRGAAAVGMGEMALALQHFKTVLDSPALPKEERLPMLDVLGRLSFQQRDYEAAVEFLGGYRREGGQEQDPMEALPQALYLAERYEEAARELEAQIAADEAVGEVPPEHQIELLASCALKREDVAAYRQALRKMVMYYPTDEYWMDLIARTVNRAGFSDRLMLDVYRLRRHTGTFSTADDYLQAGQAALKAGLPGEAQRILREGRRRGLIGHGAKADVDFQKQFEGVVERELAADRQLLEEGARLAATQSSGDALVSTGENYVGLGQYEKGLSLIRAGIAKGGLQQPEQTLLHQGYAQFVAGKLAQALETFSAIKGGDGAGDLAELWAILCRQKIEEALNV